MSLEYAAGRAGCAVYGAAGGCTRTSDAMVRLQRLAEAGYRIEPQDCLQVP